jgi:peptidoglycan/xylan/chitin deacetylase (PgdA/CDA1 family)
MSVRRAARSALDVAAEFTGLLGWSERRMRAGLTVLTYHRVLPDELCGACLFPGLVTPLSVFRDQMCWLAGRCCVMTVGEAVLSGLSEGRARDGDSRPLVGVSFDDGYADNFSIAAPVLKERGLLGTFFVTTGTLGTLDLLWFDVAARQWQMATGVQLADAARGSGVEPAAGRSERPVLAEWMGFLKRLPPGRRTAILESLPKIDRPARESLDRMMTEEEIRSLHAAGHEIGSHTVSHPLLPQLSEAELDEELAGSRRRLESWLGAGEVKGICYPNGDHDARVTGAAERAGYAYGCTTMTGRNEAGTDRMRLRRMDMNPRRVTNAAGRHDERAFRAEISLLHGAIR